MAKLSQINLKKLIENHMQAITGYPSGKDDDHEVSMAITDLRSIAHRAAQLADHYEKEGISELEGWVQSKITKSADYINAVYDEHMFSGDEEGVYTGEYDEDDCGCEDDYSEEDEDDDEELEEGKPNPKSTCCGRCGRFHVKGTTCRKPYLTGKSHCRNRPR
jgi:hypothetical protein